LVRRTYFENLSALVVS